MHHENPVYVGGSITFGALLLLIDDPRMAYDRKNTKYYHYKTRLITGIGAAAVQTISPVRISEYTPHRQGVGVIVRTTTAALDVRCQLHFSFGNSHRSVL